MSLARLIGFLLLWAPPVWAAEVVLTVPEDVLAKYLTEAPAYQRCASTDTEVACLTKIADTVVPVVTMLRAKTLAELGVTVEVRR